MVSQEHEDMTAWLVAQGMRTAETFPSPEQHAAARALEASVHHPAPEGAALEQVDAGGVPAIWVGEPNNRIVLYLHGGGYIWCSAQTHQTVTANIAKAAGARCLGLDYRRAPEAPFPAAVDDAVTAYNWLVGQGNRPEQIVLAGDSAGGGLVIAAMMAIRDRGLDLPAAGVAISPWTDLAVTGASADTADDPVVSGQGLRMMADVYLAGADAKNPLGSPLYGDLTGLPPLQIQVGSREALLDDARRIAEKAEAAGVSISYTEHPGVIHMWIVFGPDIPESLQAFRLIGEFVKEHVSEAAPRH